MKHTKKILLTSAALAVVGALLVVIGLANNAYLSLRFTSSGFSIKGLQAAEPVTLQDLNLEAFENIDAQLSYADIEFIPAEHYGVEMHYLSSEYSPSYVVENGTLTLQDKGSDEFQLTILNFDFWDDSEQNSVKIYYPKEAKFTAVKSETQHGKTQAKLLMAEQAEFRSSYGDIALENITADTLIVAMEHGKCSASALHVTSAYTYTNQYGDADFQELSAEHADVKILLSHGKLTLQSFQANRFSYENQYGDGELISVDTKQSSLSLKNGNLSFTDCLLGDIEIDTSYGNIDAVGTNSTALSIKNRNGNVTWRGSLEGTTTMMCSYGNIDLFPTLKEELYSYELSTSHGNIYFGDQSNGDKQQITHSGGSHSIKINTKNGDINLHFDA